MAGSPVSGAVISTLSLGLDIKASEILKTNSLIIRLIVLVMPPSSSQVPPDSDNDDLADGGEGKYGMVAKRVTWIGSHLQRLQSANLRWEGQGF